VSDGRAGARSGVQIHEVRPSDAGAFGTWHEAFSEGLLAGRALTTVSTLQEFTDSLSVPSPVKRRIAVGAFAHRTCVGAMLFELPLQSDRETALVHIAVPPAHRRQGVATDLWTSAVERAHVEARTVFQTEIHVPAEVAVNGWPGALFAGSLGFACLHVEDRLILDLPVPPTQLDALVSTIVEDDYEITSWAGACPDHHVVAWADLHTAMSADVPTGGLTRDTVVHTVERIRTNERRMAAHWVSLHAMALTRDGEPVGYSTIYLPIGEPEHAYQDDTLVLRAHRGHNLGTRLKAANLARLAGFSSHTGARRRWLHTYTAQDNTAMQRVNARFGFRPLEKLCEYEKRDQSV
jgi:GNAT superfamily N-acetyltransferase